MPAGGLPGCFQASGTPPRSAPAGELPALVQRGVAAACSRHQEAEPFIEQPFDVVRIDVRMAYRDIVFLAGLHHLPDRLQDRRMLVLTRMAQFLAEVALANEDHADAGDLL